MIRPTILTFLLIFSHLAFAQKLTKDEKKVVSIVDANMREALDFLEKIVNINSGTYNIAGVREVGDVFKSELDALGFETKWIEMPADMKRAGHVFGEMKGEKGKKLLLMGHMDTVFEPAGDATGFVRQDTIAFGPGTYDMKGGDMVLLFALKALHEAKLLDGSQIIVAYHGDEEAAGRPISVSRGDLIDAAKRSDIALSFEGNTGFEYATVARRGSSGWALTVTGNQAHSSRIFTPEVGAGAIYESARILHRFYEELQETNLTYSAGTIAGGTTIEMTGTGQQVAGKSNIVPNTVLIKGDLRFLSEEQKENTRKKMSAIVEDHLPGTSAEITFEDGYPAMSPTEGNMSVLKMLNQVSLDLSQGEVKPYDPGKRGAGDISFIAEYIDGLDGLGAMGKGSHSPEEYVDLTTLDSQIKRAAILIYRLSKEETGNNKGR
ncbi:M20/M25/M40 family metallo-hydrolase [uncultured Imperialibacter sp.]|uniref:M20/M25/M40 family metallo-hydrolase n=1 Tax=uncultured Imperialibacter sp. TaxID=1672639 RepID=UPI0030D8CFF0|tara:strand:+ start:24238 stop:25542 length:1305 start_codon:yes stop_codon:yes gene_type:complete